MDPTNCAGAVFFFFFSPSFDPCQWASVVSFACLSNECWIRRKIENVIVWKLLCWEKIYNKIRETESIKCVDTLVTDTKGVSKIDWSVEWTKPTNKSNIYIIHIHMYKRYGEEFIVEQQTTKMEAFPNQSQKNFLFFALLRF